MDHQRDKKNLISSLLISGSLLALLWLIHFLLYAFDIDRTLFANNPLQLKGLIGIFTSPLIHGDLSHLLSNSGSLFMFMAAMLYLFREAAPKAIVWIWLLSGVWVWIFARGSNHIGASGILYGFAAFLFFSGIFRKELVSITVSVIMALLYGTMIAGIFPEKEGVSWESHLFGFVAGAIMAWHFRKVGLHPKKKYSWDEEPEKEDNDENAVWNYRKNWTGSQNIIYPGHEEEEPDQ